MGRRDEDTSALTPEAKAVVWRIWGAGAAPGTGRSTYEQIEPVVREYVPPADQEPSITEMQSWFESGSEARWLKPDASAMVAELVLDGVGPRRSEDAIWAIGATEPKVSAGLIRRRWSSGEIDSFMKAMIGVLNVASERSSRGGGIGVEDDRLDLGFRDAARDGLVSAYARLERQSIELVNQGVHPTVGNLIDLAVALRPEGLPLLVEELRAPAHQARAARAMAGTMRSDEPGSIRRWITKRSPDPVVALTIVHTLDTVGEIDGRGPEADGVTAPEGGRELDSAVDAAVRDGAGQLLNELLEGLKVLDPADCVRWIGELLSYAPRTLWAPGNGQKPVRLTQLEDACSTLAGHLFSEFWSPELGRHFQSGLGPRRPRTWIRHQAAIAWAMRDLAPERAAELARSGLHEHRQQVAEQQDGQYLAFDSSDWRDRDWLDGLGTALALSHDELDPFVWIAAECRGLPLSVWDAEEDPGAFAAAEQRARHWLLVALAAIPRRSKLGRPVRPSAVRCLAEAVWAHCRFFREHLDNGLEASAVSELAARLAVQFGRVDDQWMLDQARSEGVGPRPLWVLFEERRAQRLDAADKSADYDEMIGVELLRIASERFDASGQFDLESLQFWGRLWLSLGGVDQAERTAMAIASHPLRVADRESRILALKLLGLVVRKRPLRFGVREYVAPLYTQLWPVLDGTPTEEIDARREIEEAFGGSEIIP